MPFLNWKSEAKTKLVIDIAAGSTGAAIVYYEPNNVPRVLYSARTIIPVREQTSLEDVKPILFESLTATLASISGFKLSDLKNKKIKSEIESVLVSFDSPWADSKLKTWSVKQDKSFFMNESVISDILKDEEVTYKKELDSKYGDNREVFHSLITGLVLNGYESEDYFTQKTNTASIRFMLTGAEEPLVRSLEDQILNAVGLKEGVVQLNFMFAFMKVLMHSYHNVHSALLVNMNGENADLLFIKNTVPALLLALPFGPGSFAKDIAEKLKIPSVVANSYITLLAEGAFEPTFAAKLETVFTDLQTNFINKLQVACDEVMGNNDFPYKIFITGAHEYEDVSKILFESAFPNHETVLIGNENKFTQEIVSVDQTAKLDEKLLVLAAFGSLVD